MVSANGRTASRAALRHGDQIDWLERQAQRPRNDAGHIQEIVDDVRQSDGVSLDRRDRVCRAVGRQLLRPQHARPPEHCIQRRSELVRHRREEVVLETVGLLGVFGHRLRANRRDDQMLVRFAQLGLELFNLRPRLSRFFPRANGLLAKRRRSSRATRPPLHVRVSVAPDDHASSPFARLCILSLRSLTSAARRTLVVIRVTVVA